nr:hypothetical protein [Bacteroidota bacterium]
MQNKKSLIFTSTLIAGAAISLTAMELPTAQTSRYSDLGTGSDVRTSILFDQGIMPANIFEMKCASKETSPDKKKGTETKDAKVKDGKATEAKCGEGKCGDGKCGSKADTTNVTDAKVKGADVKSDSKNKVKDSKTKEAKCGEGKCGVE